jgi:hypothetical protein
MCVIVTSPDSKHRPSLETLRACQSANPHGSGFAWVEGKRVAYLKGLPAELMHDSLRDLRGPVVMHFRIATVGPRTLQLCHPFPVSELPAAKRYGHAKAVLFHNGTWSGWRYYMEQARLKLSGPVSDSRVAAAVVHQLGFDALSAIPCRFAMLDASSRRISMLGDWRKYRDGCSYSNMHWLAARPERVKARGWSLCDEATALLEEEGY